MMAAEPPSRGTKQVWSLRGNTVTETCASPAGLSRRLLNRKHLLTHEEWDTKYGRPQTHPEQYRDRLTWAAEDFVRDHGCAPTKAQMLGLTTIPEAIALRHVTYLVRNGRLTVGK